jgi:hypothetical protein
MSVMYAAIATLAAATMMSMMLSMVASLPAVVSK